MLNNSCSCKVSCTTLGLAASIVIGIIAGILRYTAAITLAPAFLWVLIGIALGVVILFAVLAPIYRGIRERNCICPNINAALIGALATVFLGFLLLGVAFAATSAFGAVIAGAFIGAFSLTIISIACLTKCAIGCFFEE